MREARRVDDAGLEVPPTSRYAHPLVCRGLRAARTVRTASPTDVCAGHLPSGRWDPAAQLEQALRRVSRAERSREQALGAAPASGPPRHAIDRRNPAGMANKALVGEKVGMTQVWDDDNRVVPVTVVKVAPLRVVQVKTPERDGYSALQVTFGQQRRPQAHQARRPATSPRPDVGAGPQARRAAPRRLSRLRGRPGAHRRPARGRRARRRHRRQPGQGLRRHHEAPQLQRPEGLATAPTACTARPARSAPAPPRPGCSRARAWPAAWAARRSRR